MRILLLLFSIALSCLSWGRAGYAAETDLVDTGKVQAQLVSSHHVVAPGESFYVALRTVLDPHWHTYWRNPGDSGEPVQIDWTLPDELMAEEIIWPTPMAIATGPIINYGFEGEPLFPVQFHLSSEAQIGEVLTITGDIYYLVCKDICIPEETQISLTLNVGHSVKDEWWDGLIRYAIDQSPQQGDIRGSAQRDGQSVRFHFQNLPESISRQGNPDIYYFPYDQGVIDHSAPQTFERSERGWVLQVPAGYKWDENPPKTLTGVLRFPHDNPESGEAYKAEEVAINVGTLLDVGVLASGASSVEGIGGNGHAASTSELTFWGAILGAFLGGLILNFMPCVFPIISLKALSIAKLAHGERGVIRRQAWLYTFGVLIAFLILVAILLLLKESWGFQLQSPPVVGALALLLFLVGLNLLGLFDIGGRWQSVGHNLTQKDGNWGSFFTGALAVIVATPCTAPFMASAIGFTLTQSTVITLAVFMALALGFAAPFLILSFFPGLLRVLPKPGPWMARFKEFLAFPMFAAAIWLIWVLTQQAGETGLVRLLASFLLAALAIWFYRNRGRLSHILAGLSILAAGLIIFQLHPKAVQYAEAEAWSEARVGELRADGQAVFIDFTAAWCVTCKANKKIVLDQPDVKQMFADYNTAFLVADWTNKNDEIAEELARHGRSGVPLYLLYPPGHNSVKPMILPQILSKSVVEEALQNTHPQP